MNFRTSLVDIDGEQYHLRELSGGAVEAMGEITNPTTQGLALVALSLLDENGPKFSTDELEAGLVYVRELPNRVLTRLCDAVKVLNQSSMDDARKN